ncbi:MAG: hypothetical protein AMJ75_00480 [Phycisphaerae bacterium SM1_79]|nr:MAG: hypothetical protein AMJ75_00480 [Phycisphaerae bacterium SM1_79]
MSGLKRWKKFVIFAQNVIETLIGIAVIILLPISLNATMFIGAFAANCPPATPVDPNQCAFDFAPIVDGSEVRQCLQVWVNEQYTGCLTACEPDGEAVIVATVNVPPGVNLDLAAIDTVTDPNTGAVTRAYQWTWTPTEAQVGVHYLSFIAVDPHNATDKMTVAVLVKLNKPPVIGPCGG